MEVLYHMTGALRKGTTVEAVANATRWKCFSCQLPAASNQ